MLLPRNIHRGPFRSLFPTTTTRRSFAIMERIRKLNSDRIASSIREDARTNRNHDHDQDDGPDIEPRKMNRAPPIKDFFCGPGVFPASFRDIPLTRPGTVKLQHG